MGTSRKVNRLFGDDSYLQAQNARATCTRGGKCKPNTTVSWRSWAGSTRKTKTQKRRLPIPAAPTQTSPRWTLGLAMKPCLKPMEHPQMKARKKRRKKKKKKKKKRKKKRKKSKG